jgi:hypothetical protein
MAGIQDTVNSVLATIQSLFTVLRDVFLAVLLIFLLCFPAQLNSILSKAGISQLNGGIFTWQQAQQAATQSTAAAQATSAATDSLGDVKSALDAIASQSTDPNIKKQAADAASQAAGSIASLDNASSSLAHSVVTLQTAPPGAQSSPSPSASEGWVYVGKADPAHQHWITPPKTKIAAASPSLTVGQVVAFTDNIFLRADKAQNQTFNQSAILGAVRIGSTAAITDLAYSPARNGDALVWVKVVVKGNP